MTWFGIKWPKKRLYAVKQSNQLTISVKCSKCSSWPVDETLIRTTIPDQSGLGSNDNEEMLHVPKKSMNEATPSDAI